MTSIKTIALVAALGVLSTAAQAADLTMKPLHGLSFDIGAERAVSYFQNDNGACKLVVTLATEIDWNNAASFVPTRFETAVLPGATSRYTSTGGKTVDFACAADAGSMSIRPVALIASDDATR